MKRIFALALAIFMICAVALTAYAQVSPENPKYISITVDSIGRGTAVGSPIKVDPDNPVPVTLDATEKGGSFIKWELNGDYTIVSGSLTDKVLVILPTSNIKATAIFESDTTNGDKNTSDTSPKTGDLSVYALGILMLAGIAGLYAFKKVKA